MMNQQPIDPALERGLDDLRARGAELLQRDQQAAAERERQAQQQFAQQLYAAESQAVDRLRTLTPRYQERGALAQEAQSAIAKLFEADKAIRSELNAIEGALQPFWASLDPMKRQPRWIGLRTRAGLNESHLAVSLHPNSDAGKVGATAVQGVVNQNIGAGVIQLGKVSQQFNFDR